MPSGQSAVSVLLDVVATVSFATNDVGGGETYANPVTTKIDKITVKKMIASADHSTAQDAWEMNRKTKYSFEITVETKLYPQSPGTGNVIGAYPLLNNLQSSDLAQLVATAQGAGVTAVGLITDISADYAGPSTLKFSLKAHGSAVVFGG